MCIRLDTIPECDQQTDRQTDRRTGGFSTTVSRCSWIGMLNRNVPIVSFKRLNDNYRLNVAKLNDRIIPNAEARLK